MSDKKLSPVEKILSEIERDSLARLASDIVTLNALKKVLLFGVYYNGTLKDDREPDALMNFALQIDTNNNLKDEDLGRILRAKQEGIVVVEIGFKELEKFKVVLTDDKTVVNGAR